MSELPRRFWTEEELRIVRELYPVRSTKEVAAAVSRTISAVYGAAEKLGLNKSQAYLDSPESGRLRKGENRPGTEGTQFKKGCAPFNKGLKRPAGWSPGRMRETQFKRGVRQGAAATNWCPVGTLLSDSEGYLRIKVREGLPTDKFCGFGNVEVWPLYGRYVWEQVNGSIPPSHVVIFKNGDRANCDIGNLELISRADLARRNSMWNRYPPELARLIQLKGALNRKIRRADAKENND